MPTTVKGRRAALNVTDNEIFDRLTEFIEQQFDLQKTCVKIGTKTFTRAADSGEGHALQYGTQSHCLIVVMWVRMDRFYNLIPIVNQSSEYKA